MELYLIYTNSSEEDKKDRKVKMVSSIFYPLSFYYIYTVSAKHCKSFIFTKIKDIFLFPQYSQTGKENENGGESIY